MLFFPIQVVLTTESITALKLNVQFCSQLETWFTNCFPMCIYASTYYCWIKIEAVHFVIRVLGATMNVSFSFMKWFWISNYIILSVYYPWWSFCCSIVVMGDNQKNEIKVNIDWKVNFKSIISTFQLLLICAIIAVKYTPHTKYAIVHIPQLGDQTSTWHVNLFWLRLLSLTLFNP